MKGTPGPVVLNSLPSLDKLPASPLYTKVISLAPQEPLKVRMGKDLPLNSPASVTAGTAYGSLPYRKSLNLQRQFRLKGNQGFGYSLATGVSAIRRGPLTRWNSQSQKPEETTS